MEQWKIDYRTEVKKATTALREAELILSRNSYKYPKIAPDLKQEDRVKIPEGYIRTADHFRKEYQLTSVVRDKNCSDNIAYALQASDLFNYFINRFDISLSVKAIFLKMAIINGFSTIEAILSGSMIRLHGFCLYDKKNSM